jgi:septum site-determining protein MinD
MDGRVIVITSGKGGVGKTTFTANVGYALAKKDFKVLLVDADIGLRNLDLLLGLERRVIYNVMDVINGEIPWQKALVKDKRLPTRLFLLPASQTNFKEDVQKDKFLEIIQLAKKEFDFILIDSPAGIEYGFKLAATPADEAIIVTIPEVTAIRDADRVIGILDNMGKEKQHLVVNRVDVEGVRNGDVLAPEYISGELSVPLLGIIPMDSVVTEATNLGKPVIALDEERGKTSFAGLGFKNVADRIANPETPLWDPIKEVPKQTGILGLFSRFLGGRR